MSQYKVLPSYSDINTLNTGYEEETNFASFSLIYSQDSTVKQDGDQQKVIEPQSPVIEIPNTMEDRTTFFPWEQEGVIHLQQALNSQTPVQPVSYPAIWGEETLDLSSTSTISSTYPHYSPPSRLTILNPRNIVLSHPMTGTGPHHGAEDSPVTSTREGQEDRRPRLKSRDSEQDRLCKVCGEKAGKHSYYGGQACPSCRAFFRRSVQSGYNATYFCVKDGQCEVTLKTRKNCQACRYKRCEAAGMKTTWVLTEEERKTKFHGKGKKRRSSSVSEHHNDNMVEIKTDDNAYLTEDDIAAISAYVAASEYWEISKVNDMDTELIRKIIRMIAFGCVLDQQGQEQLEAVLTDRAVRFANKISELHTLTHSEKSLILSHNIPLVVILFTSSMFSTSMVWTTQLAPLLGAGEVEKLNTKLRTLNVSGLDSLKITFNQFFTPYRVITEEEDRRLSTLVEDIGSWHQDPTELILLSLVLMFTADMMDLTEYRIVEDIQIRFAVLLHNFINYRHPEDPDLARSRFSKGMMLVSKCREVAMIKKGSEVQI